ncbi:MAG: CDP-glucose 4,6-dehydratase [Bacteroidota bacterium]|nr:CDP-glucose 4,6-dehydratase [Bacteroidota bacterium]
MLVANVTPAQVLEHFKGKKVFITGHTGFKGSWLSLLLSEAGALLKGYSLAPDHENSLYENLEPHLNLESVIADIRNADKIKQEILSFQPDFIFHLAAQPLVRYSYAHPAETFEVNVMGTVHVLEAIRDVSKKCTAVIITTDKVYENNEAGMPFKEQDKLGGHDPYSSSKAAAEIVVQSYQKSFFPLQEWNSHLKAVATARAGNVIGGGDRSADRIIPDLIKSLESGNTLQVRNPDAVRPWQHVLDPLTGYLKLAFLLDSDAHKYSGSYNFGPNPEDQLSVREIVQLAISCWGTGNYETPQKSKQPHEANHLRLDITKSITQLHWKPQWNAKEAVERTVKWYGKSSQNLVNKKELCLIDIHSFINQNNFERN